MDYSSQELVERAVDRKSKFPVSTSYGPSPTKRPKRKKVNADVRLLGAIGRGEV